jgi:N-acetylglucosamine kinase-like BadF-type ATPase
MAAGPDHVIGSLAGWRMVAVDVGGTETRVRLDVGADPDRRYERTFAASQASSSGFDLRHVASAVRAALDATGGAHSGPVSVAIGATGWPDLAADPRAVGASLHDLGVDRAVLAADMVTAHIGALRLTPGVVVAAGTGVVALAWDLAAVWHRVDGWGYVLGDDGSGAWIGTCGLRAALRTVDGRRPASPELARRAWEQFGDPAALVREVYSRADRAGVLAGFAPAVAEAAAAGDQVAARIMRRAGHLLGRTAAAAVRATGLHRVACTGGVFAAGDQVLAPMRRHLTGVADAELIAPGGSPLDGAAELARLAVAEPDRLPRHPPFISVIGDHP